MTSADATSRGTAHHPCPKCGKPLRRVRRRAIDHWISKVMPVHRYKCTRPRCGWEGNLRQRGPDAGA